MPVFADLCRTWVGFYESEKRGCKCLLRSTIEIPTSLDDLGVIMSRFPLPPPDVEIQQNLDCQRNLDWKIRRLLLRLTEGRRLLGELDEVESLLGCLPLTTVEFGVARSRLNNCRAYLATQELGAARFELRQLLGRV